jgi:hypothetical protein
MSQPILKLLVFSVALISLPVLAQDNTAGPGCGDPSAKFSVSTNDPSKPSAQPDSGKALVFIIEDDSNFNSFPKPTTRAGVDRKWVGATHGNSWLSFSVDPGEHHLCASWQTSVVLGKGKQTSAAHFTAEPGGIYYFEVKNKFFQSQYGSVGEMTLDPLDSDEGQVLARKYHMVTSQPKN